MNVRLTKQQIQGIVLAVKKHIRDISVKLYLYGSRVTLEAKGGDIDLLLLFDSIEDKKTLLSIKHVILSEIKNNIGDQKVDIVFAYKQEFETNDFLKLIFPSAVLLYPL